MGFRDDREANVQRIEALERELVATKAELDAVALRAAEVDDLRTRMAALTDERDAAKRSLEGGWEARFRSLRTWMAIGAGAAILGGLYVHHRFAAERTAAQHAASLTDLARQRLQEELAQEETRRHALEAQLDEAARSAAEAGDRSARRAPAWIVIGGTVGGDAARGTSVPPGTACALSVRDVAPGACIALLTCRDVPVYPFDDRLVPIRCDSLDGDAWSSRTGRPLGLVETSGDRDGVALRFDAATRTVDVRGAGPGGARLELRIAVDSVVRAHVP